MTQETPTYLIEYFTIDHQIKVTALDPKTGLEAVVICPANTIRNELSALAVRKLEYMLKKKQQ